MFFNFVIEKELMKQKWLSDNTIHTHKHTHWRGKHSKIARRTKREQLIRPETRAKY